MKNKKMISVTVITIFTGIFVIFSCLKKTEIETASSTTIQNSILIATTGKTKNPVIVQLRPTQVVVESQKDVAKNENEEKNQQNLVIDPELKRQLLSSQKVFVR